MQGGWAEKFLGIENHEMMTWWLVPERRAQLILSGQGTEPEPIRGIGETICRTQ